MWFNTPENVCSSSYAARCCARAAVGAAHSTTRTTTLAQRSQPLFRILDLTRVPARRKRDETIERRTRFLLLVELLLHDAEIIGHARIARVGVHRLLERLLGPRPVPRSGQRFAEIEQQA